MQYNLLYYGFNTSFCTSQNNNVNLKDQYLSTIIDYVNPDIFAVNELGRGEHNVTRILNNVLNTDGQNRFSAATYTNTTNSTIVNMLFYDHNKFTLYYEAVVASVVRDINLYTLYYNDEEMLAAGDTIFLTSIVAHFKAGSSSADQQTRTAEAQAVMSFLNSSNIRGNLLFMGDFNMKSSFEQAYQHITFHPNEAIRFHDPINQPGQWFNNPAMAPYHTQSTRTGSHPCFVTGGLDDRFDFILASDAVIQGYMGLQYIDGTYKTLGQDGNRFNQSLISPTNNSAPQNVIEALYGMSDHLPVIVKLKTGNITVGTQNLIVDQTRLNFNNPVGDELRIKLNQDTGPVTISMYSVTGEKILSFSNQTLNADTFLTLDVSSLPGGVYIIKIEGRKIRPLSGKIIKI